MIRRDRVARVALGLCLVLLSLTGAMPLHAGSPEPSGLIQAFNHQLLLAMSGGRSLGYRGRYDLLEPAVKETFDIAAMTRIAVGPEWTALSDSQKNRMIDAFGRFTISTFAVRFDDFGGEKFEVGEARSVAGGVLVENRLVKPDGERIRIDYVTHETANGWGVVDVYLDGTISELAVRRSEFASILKRSGAEGLIAALEHRTQQMAMKDV